MTMKCIALLKKLFPDESDLVVVLRAILRKKQISENVRLNAEALLRKVNQETTKNSLIVALTRH